MPTLEELPIEIILEISQFLAPKDQYAFARVNRKYWRLFEHDMINHKAMTKHWHEIQITESKSQKDGEFEHYEHFFRMLLRNPKVIPYIQELQMSWLYFYDHGADTFQMHPYHDFFEAGSSFLPLIDLDEAETILTLIRSNKYIPKEVKLSQRSELDTLEGSIRLGCLDALEAQTLCILSELRVLSMRPHPEQAFTAGLFVELAHHYSLKHHLSIGYANLPLRNLRELEITFEDAHGNDARWLHSVLHLPALHKLCIEGLYDGLTDTMRPFKKPPNVRILHLGINRIQALLMKQLLSSLALEELWLRYCTYDGSHDDGCAYCPEQWIEGLKVRSMTTLKMLLLSGSYCTPIRSGHGLFFRSDPLSRERGLFTMQDFSVLEVLSCQWKDVIPEHWKNSRLSTVMPKSLEKLKFEGVPFEELSLTENILRVDLEELRLLNDITLELEDGPWELSNNALRSVDHSEFAARLYRRADGMVNDIQSRLTPLGMVVDELDFRWVVYGSGDQNSDDEEVDDTDEEYHIRRRPWCHISISKKYVQNPNSWPVH